MTLRASIDIGSNSCLLEIGSFQGRKYQQIYFESNITGLGRNLDKSGEFAQIAMDETFEALAKYRKKIDSFSIDANNIVITATEAARVARNSKDFFKTISDKLSFNIQIINGKGEAYYSALGASLGITTKDEEIVLMDIGGASTELIRIKKDPFELLDYISMPIGVVRVNDWKADNVFDSKSREVFSYDLNRFKTNKIVGVAGTTSSHGAMFLNLSEYIDEKVNNLVIKTKDYFDFKEKIDQLSSDDLLEMYPFIGKRANVSHSGAIITKLIMEKFEVQEMQVSTFGLRHGTLYSGKIASEFLS